MALSGVTLTDNLTDLVAAGCTIPTTLAANASFRCAYSAVAAAGTRTNTATASATGAGPVSASAIVIGHAPPPPILISKGVRSPNSGAYASSISVLAGTTVYFRIVVTNIGSTTATGLTLTDNLTDLAAVGCTIPLDPGGGRQLHSARTARSPRMAPDQHRDG